MRASLLRSVILLLWVLPLLAAVIAGGMGVASAAGGVYRPLGGHGVSRSLRGHLGRSSGRGSSAASASGRAAAKGHPLPVSVDVHVGFQDQYRASAWTPIRVTLHNRTSSLIQGTASITDAAPSNGYHSFYQEPVVLPAGATKLITLYMPGSDVSGTGNVDVAVQSNGTTVGNGSNFGTDFGSESLVAGVLAGDPLTTQWLASDLTSNPTLMPLTPATIDPIPQVLGTFDVIVLTNADTSRLDSDQLTALRRYVENGGGIILVGGPDWQETLKPLPSWLVPGALVGTRTLPDLRGLLGVEQAPGVSDAAAAGGSASQSRCGGAPSGSSATEGRGYGKHPARESRDHGTLPAAASRGSGNTRATNSCATSSTQGEHTAGRPAAGVVATTVSVLAHPRGTVVASEDGVPLAVVANEGQGHILYLAFDPNVAPIPQWSQGGAIVSDLFTMAAPEAVSRASSQNGNQPPFVGTPYGPPMMGQELANVPAAALPSLILFIVLTVLYVLLLGPANFLLLRRFGRRELAWITVPLLAILCFGSTFLVAFRLKGNTVLLNSIGIVRLAGSDAQRPATIYTGLFAPVRGDYTLTYNAPALGTGVFTEQFYSGPGPYVPVRASLPSLNIQQGSQTSVTLPSMNMWSMRDVELQTTVDIPGTISDDLHVDSHGNIVGTIHNGTNLDIARPVILAGYTVTRLADLPAGVTRQVKVRPNGSLFRPEPLWLRAYSPHGYPGQFYGFAVRYGRPGIFIGGPCCYGGPSLPSESTLEDRIRSAATLMPEALSVQSSGEVILAGWTQQSLGSMTVDGAAPQRRDLTLLYTPLSVHLARGPFTLRMGTVGAHLLAINPLTSSPNGCCSPYYQSSITIGSGGWGLFRFDIPHQGKIHFRTLSLWANLGGTTGTDNIQLYDRLTGKWVTFDVSSGKANVSSPNRFFAPDGSLLMKVRATADSTFANNSPSGYPGYTVAISDPYQDLQISGTGVVS